MSFLWIRSLYRILHNIPWVRIKTTYFNLFKDLLGLPFILLHWVRSYRLMLLLNYIRWHLIIFFNLITIVLNIKPIRISGLSIDVVAVLRLASAILTLALFIDIALRFRVDLFRLCIRALIQTVPEVSASSQLTFLVNINAWHHGFTNLRFFCDSIKGSSIEWMLYG